MTDRQQQIEAHRRSQSIEELVRKALKAQRRDIWTQEELDHIWARVQIIDRKLAWTKGGDQ